ncbi:MAG: potassium transporter TrkG [Pseudomonadota bacterium]
MLRASPAKLLTLSYVSVMVAGWITLSLPWLRLVDVSVIDSLFMAVSAVSTTGLVTVDPGSTYNWLGQLVLLLLFQLGGVGYMTIGSFSVLAVHERLTTLGEKVAKAEFALPKDCEPTEFIRTVLAFTLICETLGALALWWIFSSENHPAPLWSAVFHSVSAFCTAGFSLNSNSFEGFQDHAGLNATLALLSLCGAMGFLIVWDLWRNLTSRAYHLGFTSKVIIRMTFFFLTVGTLIVLATETSLANLPAHERLLAAFFQTMSASTTVGFNTVPISSLGTSTLLILLVLMSVGASPSGTGGGLKTTTCAALLGLVRSKLKQRPVIRFFGRKVPNARLHAATASAVLFGILLTLALFLLALTDRDLPLDALLFESVSALGTVGLSTGITAELSPLGKAAIIVLMTAGRVGVLTFGLALAMHEESDEEREDNELLL